VHWEEVRGPKDQPGGTGWRCALSEQPIGHYAGDSSTIFEWTIQVDQCPTIFAWGVDDTNFATTALSDVRGCGGGMSAHDSDGGVHALWPLRGPWKRAGDFKTTALDPKERVAIGCTADLKADTLTFSVGVVDAATGRIDPARMRKVRRPQPVPALAKAHFWVGGVAGMKVTLLDNE
jgi:hypothetical protein